MTESAEPWEDAVLYGPSLDADAETARHADELVRLLASVVPATRPPARVKRRLMDQIAAEPRPTAVINQPTTLVVRGAEESWMATPIPGLWHRLLFQDPRTGRRTGMLKLDAGCVIPPHPHDEDEEVFVLEGDLRTDDDQIFRPGDYQRNTAGSLHGRLHSVEGCTCLMIYTPVPNENVVAVAPK